MKIECTNKRYLLFAFIDSEKPDLHAHVLDNKASVVDDDMNFDNGYRVK